MKRHDVSDGTCWCGSMHDWELARIGVCKCTDAKCEFVHYSGRKK